MIRVAAIMLYAWSGRIGVEMIHGMFRDLGQNDGSVLMVKEAITTLAPDHPIRSHLALASDLQFDAALLDTFLHGRERSDPVADCLDLVRSAGLVFQDWILKSAEAPAATAGNAFQDAAARLPDETCWSVMDRIAARNACHFVMACRADRPPHHQRARRDLLAMKIVRRN